MECASVARRAATRRDGLTLLEVLVAATVLAMVLLGVASMSGSTQVALQDLDLAEAAAHSARSTLENFQSAAWTSLHPFYNAFRLTSPSPGPKVSARFEVRASGLAPGNQFGRVTVREPTQAEAPRYNRGNGPRFPYSNPSNPYSGTSTSIGSPSATSEPKLYLIIVEVDIPAAPGRPPVRTRLQTWRFAL